MNDQIGIAISNPEATVIDEAEDGLHLVTSDISYKRLILVNVVFCGQPGGEVPWILIDAGIKGSAHYILSAARSRYGQRPPQCIVLTHGHFDHVGALSELLEVWDVPVYAHSWEIEHLDGRSSYPIPDPTVGGGVMSALSPFFPRAPIVVGDRLRTLPEDGSIPSMPEWRWLHTPGHTAGHISLWREHDRVIIAGDAFITTRQESAYAVLVQKPEIHGPPMYFTPDWMGAKRSVELLAALQPEICVTGHGPAMRGQEMRNALTELAARFDQVAVPHGD